MIKSKIYTVNRQAKLKESNINSWENSNKYKIM